MTDERRTMIHNPILPGFNPDPSILRVGEDYYIATSTFEWFPGVQIHHSRDLVHWRLLTRPLSRTGLLDMRGIAASCGIWAPCLTWSDGLFHLVYTVTRTKGEYKDTPNYLTTSRDILGPWSDGIYLNSSGFDASLFHDEDGRKWLLNMQWDHRPGHNAFAGILLQEYCPRRKTLVGPIRSIFRGTRLGVTEGPHLYRHDGRYYLMTAEGGTGCGHAVTVARADRIEGPYEVDPQNPMLTSAGDRNLPLQKAGHASLVETQNGEWYLAHLVGRPLMPMQRCPLGRETAIQKVRWTSDGWLRLEDGGNRPQVDVPAPGLPAHPFAPEPARDDFDATELGIHFQTLRTPVEESWMSLTERPGWLRLRGRESFASAYDQSLVARRWQSFRFEASTVVEFEPEDFQQMAGLVCFYDGQKHFYLYVSRDETLGKCVNILCTRAGRLDAPIGNGVSIEGHRRCRLKAVVERERLRFYYAPDESDWRTIGHMFDASALSDEAPGEGAWTGAFVGLCAQDLSGRRLHADFDFFEYRELE